MAEWDAGTTYATGDVVTRSGVSYTANAASTGADPAGVASFVGSDSMSATDGGGSPCPLPVGAQAGDTAVITYASYHYVGDGPKVIPAGYTQVALYPYDGSPAVSNENVAMYFKVLTSTEITAGSVATMPDHFAATVHVFRNVVADVASAVTWLGHWTVVDSTHKTYTEPSAITLSAGYVLHGIGGTAWIDTTRLPSGLSGILACVDVSDCSVQAGYETIVSGTPPTAITWLEAELGTPDWGEALMALPLAASASLWDVTGGGGVVVVGTSHAGSDNNSASFNVALPTGTEVGDVLVLVEGTAYTPPGVLSGFNQVDVGSSGNTFYSTSWVSVDSTLLTAGHVAIPGGLAYQAAVLVAVRGGEFSVSAHADSMVSPSVTPSQYPALAVDWVVNQHGVVGGSYVLELATQADLTGVTGDLAEPNSTTVGYLNVPSGDTGARTWTDASAVSPVAGTLVLIATGSGGGGGAPTSYTLVITDADTVVESTSADPFTIEVPPNADVAFPLGTVVGLRQYGAGQVTVTAGAGVTLRSRGGAFTLAGQYAEASLMQRATDEWVLVGDLTT